MTASMVLGPLTTDSESIESLVAYLFVHLLVH